MRVFLAVLIFGGLVSLGFGEEGRVKVDSVNIRVGPSDRAEVVGNLMTGDLIQVEARDGDWLMVLPPRSLWAYVSSDYIHNGTITGNRVNYRTGPGLSYARLGQLSKGEKVEVGENLGKWVKFRMPATARLWVFSQFIETSLPVAPTPSAVLSSVRETVTVFSPPPTTSKKNPPSPSPQPIPVKTPPVFSAVSGSGIITRTGYIRPLSPAVEVGNRQIVHKLIRERPDTGVLGWLCSESIELDRYHDRRVRIYAREVEGDTPRPLYEVKGLQVLW